MIPFSGLSRFSGHFGCDGPSPVNRDTTVVHHNSGPTHPFQWMLYLLFKMLPLFSVHVHQIVMILFSGLSRFSGHFGGDGPSPLNRDTTVQNYIIGHIFSAIGEYLIFF